MADFSASFERLTLPEKVRMAKFAESRGLTVLPIADEVAGLEPEPIETIHSSKLTSEHFPRADESELEALKKYYAAVEQRPIYPPLGYCPSLRQEEKNAAALLSFIATAVENWGKNTIENNGYPVAKLPPIPAKRFSR